jgi:hypothetical protein
MYFAFLENLARRETGRLLISVQADQLKRLVIYPADVPGNQSFIKYDKSRKQETYFLEYGEASGKKRREIKSLVEFAISLIRLVPVCSRIDLYIFSEYRIYRYAVLTIILSRLLGIKVILHDYRFCTGKSFRFSRLLHSLCHRLDIGDVSAPLDDSVFPRRLSIRAEANNLEAYNEFAEKKAVPRVIVYGDFDDSRIISLAKRTHDLVKQKYPRTEFLLVSLSSGRKGGEFRKRGDNSISMKIPKSEDELVSIFEESDILLLLSPGGLNRYFMVRARASGYPIISNGIDYSPAFGRGIVVDRDSYSGLADAVIRLVDDEAYYQSFMASP